MDKWFTNIQVHWGMFTLPTTIMSTFNDFTTYGMLSRWSTKGYMAWPTCYEDTSSFWAHWKDMLLGSPKFGIEKSYLPCITATTHSNWYSATLGP